MTEEFDKEYVDQTIESVKDIDGNYTITCDGWSLWCGKDCPMKPEVGQIARLYGKGIGSRVRGLFINGTKIWYRTVQQDKEHSEIELYGVDATDWLKRWDEGRGVWSIEMGGISPGYEQCIQITAAEVLRWLLEHKPTWDDQKTWDAVREKLEQHGLHENKIIKELGLSGAQWGGAVNLACHLYKQGPRKIMSDEAVKDRKIQVSKTFPKAE